MMIPKMWSYIQLTRYMSKYRSQANESDSSLVLDPLSNHPVKIHKSVQQSIGFRSAAGFLIRD